MMGPIPLDVVVSFLPADEFLGDWLGSQGSGRVVGTARSGLAFAVAPCCREGEDRNMTTGNIPAAETRSGARTRSGLAPARWQS